MSHTSERAGTMRPVDGSDAQDPAENLADLEKHQQKAEEEDATGDQASFRVPGPMLNPMALFPGMPIFLPFSTEYYSLLLGDLTPLIRLLAAQKFAPAPTGQFFDQVQGAYNPFNSINQLIQNYTPLDNLSPFQIMLSNVTTNTKRKGSVDNDSDEPEDLSSKMMAKKKHKPPTGLDCKVYRQRAQMRCLCVYRKPRPTDLPYMSLEELECPVDKLVKGQPLIIFINKWVKQPAWTSGTLFEVVKENDGTARIALREENGKVNWIGHFPCKQCFLRSICVLLPPLPSVVYHDFLISPSSFLKLI